MVDSHSTESAFWSLVDKSTPYRCWIWRGKRQKTGYGYYPSPRDRTTLYGLAHRVAYVLVKGPIPAGMHLDHVCRMPACVNPDHLEVVTTRENTLRGVGPSAVNKRKTCCSKGHPFDADNTRRRDGVRYCRQCNRESTRKSVRRKREYELAVGIRPRRSGAACFAGMTPEQQQEARLRGGRTRWENNKRQLEQRGMKGLPKCDLCKKFVRQGVTRCQACTR
jgi:hypothetical protein